MPKITLDSLKKIKEKALEEQNLRDGEKEWKITVHMGTCGIAAGARDVLQALLEELQVRNVKNAMIVQAGCIGLCEQEPLVTVEHNDEAPIRYGKINSDKIRQIVAQHIINGKPVNEYVLNK